MTDPAGLAVTDGTWLKGPDQVPRRYPWTAFHPVALCHRALVPPCLARHHVKPQSRASGGLFMEHWPRSPPLGDPLASTVADSRSIVHAQCHTVARALVLPLSLSLCPCLCMYVSLVCMPACPSLLCLPTLSGPGPSLSSEI